jgi:hypothetical protein
MSQTINYTTFEARDLHDYNELGGMATATAVTKGEVAIVQDRMCFHLYGKTAAQISEGNADITPIYKMRQVNARKRTGTGQEFAAGDNVYYYPSDQRVSPAAIGIAGTDYYWCGTVKRAATASEETVLIEYDGTRYTEDI